MREYNPLLVGIVLHINQPGILRQIKTQLVETMQKLDFDQRVYIYHPDHENIPQYTGQSVGMLANYSTPKMIPGKAMEHVMDLFALEDEDDKRLLLFVTDSYLPKDGYGVRRAMRKDCTWSGDQAYEIFLYGVGCDESLQDLTEYHPRCSYVKDKELGKFLEGKIHENTQSN